MRSYRLLLLFAGLLLTSSLGWALETSRELVDADTGAPSSTPSIAVAPSKNPSTAKPSNTPSRIPSISAPSRTPSQSPRTAKPSRTPSRTPSKRPSTAPKTSKPSKTPSRTPTSSTPSGIPSRAPSTQRPSLSPSSVITSVSPSAEPTITTKSPLSSKPSNIPSTSRPSRTPSRTPSTSRPSKSPSKTSATASPITFSPTLAPSNSSMAPSVAPTLRTKSPIRQPSAAPTSFPRTFPSILVFLADDLDYGDVGYLGGIAKTPNIDALANSPNGIRLDNFHAGSSICSPSRISLLSGRVPERDCINQQLTNNAGPPFFRMDMPSSVRYAKKAGYKTAFFGKWHIGRTPMMIGFDYWLFTPVNVPTFDPGCFCPERVCLKAKCRSKISKCVRPVGYPRCTSRFSWECQLGHIQDAVNFGTINWSCDVLEGRSTSGSGSKTMQFPRNVESAEYFGERVADYLGTIQRNEYFYIQMSFHEPHEPFIASPQMRADCASGKTCTSEIGPYTSNTLMLDFYGVIASMDNAVGTIVNKLKSMGRMDDTIIIYTSDNGGEIPNLGRPGVKKAVAGGVPASAPTRNLKGFKRSVYEGGVRVPALIHWPQKIKSNVIVREPTSMLDIFPTLTEIMLKIKPSIAVGEPTPRGDGLSLTSLITNPQTWTRTRSFGVCQPVTGVQPQTCGTWAFYEGRYKIIINSGNLKSPEVYDVVNDQDERTNIAGGFADLHGFVTRSKAWHDNVMVEYTLNCLPKKQRKG